MKKRLMSLMLAAMLLVSLFPLTAAAADIVDHGTCGANLTWTLDSDGLLTISGTGAMTDFSWNSSPFYQNTSIQTVIIEPGVTSIGSYAFDSCSSLTSVTIPEGVTSIGNYAFYNCSSLMSVTIPNSVTSLGERAFYSCSSLTSITIPENVTSIENSAFSYCYSLTSITIPESVTSIGDSAFYSCSSLTNINYSGTIKQWNAISIGGLNEPLRGAVLHYPGGSCVGTGTFGENLIWVLNADGLLTISGTGPMTDYSSGYASFYGNRDSVRSVIIEPGATTIGNYAFYRCSNLTSITIPESVTSIGHDAFRKCSSLTSVIIPDGVTSIGLNAFEECSSLTSVTIPESVTSIGDSTFYGCSSLMSVEIPESVTSIGSYAFRDCTSLTSITIPESVTSIGSGAFFDCSSLISVTISNSVTSIGGSTFYGCSSLTSITIPDSVTSIGGTAFSGCISLTSIRIPGAVTSIGYETFQNCKRLTEVYFGGDESAWKQAVDTTNADLLNAPHVHLNTASPDGHFYPISVPAACEADGYTARTCDCGYEYDRVVTEPAIGHDWTPWATLLEPTATTKGIAVRICANDPKHVEFKALPTVAECPSKNFTDVDFNAYYHIPMDWAVENGITTGVTATTFEPNRSCSRAQMVTFLWRAMGSPEPTVANPFADVPNNKYYTKAVLWALEQGITTGIDKTHFAPDRIVTRAQTVTFLWRLEGKPEPTGSTSFPDVPAGASYAKAVSWASEQGITTGTNGRFNPNNDCTRAQIVTFLYRTLAG